VHDGANTLDTTARFGAIVAAAGWLVSIIRIEIMRRLWRLLRVQSNRALLSWIGGGLVVVAAGLWAVVTYVWPPGGKPALAPSSVSASGGGIAAGRDISGSTITQHTTGSPPAPANPAPADRR
jgi:hypothetical protein